jgi:hypothetical protein
VGAMAGGIATNSPVLSAARDAQAVFELFFRKCPFNVRR